MDEEVERTPLIEAFCEITSSSREEALFFLESHNFDVDAAVSTFLDNNTTNEIIPASHPILPAPNLPSQSRSPSPPSRSRSPYRLRSKKKKKKKHDVAASSSGRRTGGIRTLADLNKRPAARVDDDDDDSDDDDYEEDDDSDESPQEYYTGGQKSGMLVQDPTKGNNDVDAIFSQARHAGALEGPTDSQHPSQISKSFSGTGRLLTGASVSVVPQQPESVNHNIVFWLNGFTIDDGPLRRVNDPTNAPFLESIRKSECPKELEPADRRIPVHVNLTRREENYNEPQKPYIPFHGAGRTLGSTSSSAMEEPTITISTTANTAPLPSMGLVVDDNLPSTSIQIRLADGTRMVSRFNFHHTVNDVRAFIDASRPGGARNYELQIMGFPPKKLVDSDQTIEQVGLANSVVLQKF